jgi:hypothetical protein
MKQRVGNAYEDQGVRSAGEEDRIASIFAAVERTALRRGADTTLG